MDATAVSSPDLFDFIESFERKEKYSTDTAAAVVEHNNITIEDTISDSSFTTTNEKSQTADVWLDIAEALNIWSQRILYVESRYNTTASFRQTIEESLRRQQLDGFLDHNDLCELRHITDLWTNSLQSISCFTVGCDYIIKRDFITCLLELYTLKQIDSNLFIETCLKL